MTAGRSVVLDTKWFAVVAEPQPRGDAYYMLELADYVSVIAITRQRELLLVRQYRPVVRRETLELPSGHVEPGESPEQAARRELAEETGYVAADFQLLGALVPDVGRLTNRMWCYFAGDAHPGESDQAREEGVSLVVMPEADALRRAADGTIDHALNLAPLFLAVARGKLVVNP